MKGARPITKDELNEMISTLYGSYTDRNRVMLTLQYNAGLRVSELAGLNVGDVWQHNKPVNALTLRRETTKRHKERTIPLNKTARETIYNFISWKRTHGEKVDHDRPLFISRNRRRITRQQVHNILKQLVNDAELTGKVSTHSLRKGFGTAIFKNTKNILAVKELLGHDDIKTTQKYIGIGYGELEAAVNTL